MLYKTTITQTKKELFSADFDIGGDILNGKFHYSVNVLQELYGDGKLQVRKDEWEPKDYATIETKGVEWPKNQNKIYRPQRLLRNGEPIGEVVQKTEGNIFNNYDYNEITYNRKTYKLYSMGLKERTIHTVYNNNEEVIAQVVTSNIIYDDKHNYTIYSKSNDFDETVVLLLLCLYMYIITRFAAFIKVRKGIEKYYGKTRNKTLISKYDESFLPKEGIKDFSHQ